jgi:hypothetical protein
MPVRHIFEDPTLAELSEVIGKAKEQGAVETPAIERVSRAASRVKLSAITGNGNAGNRKAVKQPLQ